MPSIFIEPRTIDAWPTVDLENAIDYARGLWRRIQIQPAPHEIVLAALGESADGVDPRDILASQLFYGLLDCVADDYQFSERTIAILQSDQPQMRSAAIAQAAAEAEAVVTRFRQMDSAAAGGGTLQDFLTAHGLPTERAERAAAATVATASFAARSRREHASLAIGNVIAEMDETVFMQGRLSPHSSYRLLVSGNLGSRELDLLIKLLTVHREGMAGE